MENESNEEQVELPQPVDDMFQKIEIPRDDCDGDQAYKFSWKRLWAFTGPGFLMSIAYLDPGNIESDLEQGAVAEYRLLWVLLLSTCIGLLMQVLASRLGTVTGLHLAEICYARYPKITRIMLWVMVEIAIIGSDMQEVIGTAIAFHLLSNRKIPLYAGVLITISDTFVFLLLEQYGLRKLEAFFGFLITTMAITFGYEYVVVQPDQANLIKHMFIPDFKKRNWNSAVVLQAVGVVGAVIMPHNFYLHSALVKSRAIERKDKRAVKEANFYYLIESTIALLASFIINVFVVAVFAKAFFNKTYNEVYANCVRHNNPYKDYFFRNGTQGNNTIDADLFKGGVFLGCQYGPACMYIWAIGLLAAGQSSTMTGTYSGQFTMQGFLNIDWAIWKRLLFTRGIAIAPTFALAFYAKIDGLTQMNDWLNALMNLQLPFAILPLLTFTNDKQVMGSFRNSKKIKIITWILAFVIIGINIFFMVDFLQNIESKLLYVPLGFVIVIWISFCCVLVYYAVVFTYAKRLTWDRFRFSLSQMNGESTSELS